MQKRGKFIVLEGFDGVGKTTLSRVIAQEKNYSYHKSPEGVFSNARKYFDVEGINFIDRFSFYSGVSIRNSLIASTLINQGKNIIMDRYYYSVIAYHYEEFNKLPSKMQEMYNFLLQPDLVFYVDVKFEEICTRLDNIYVELPDDDKLFLKKEKHKKITEIYKSVLPINIITIDNNRNDINLAKEEILKYL